MFELHRIGGGPLQRLVDHGVGTDRCSEEPGCDIGHGLCLALIRAFTGHRRRSADTDRRLIRSAAVTKPTHQNSDICPLAAAIGMQFIKHDEFETGGIADDPRVQLVLPGEQEFGHHEVGEQDVRRIFSDLHALFPALLSRVTRDYWFECGR